MSRLFALVFLLSLGLQAAEGDRLLFPWISNNSDFDSLLIVNNSGPLPTTVTLTARRADGTLENIARTIPAGGFLRETASELFPDMGQGAGYSVIVGGGTDEISGRWLTFNRLTGSSGSPSQAAGIHLNRENSDNVGQSILFGYLPNNADFFAAPVLVNLGDAATAVTLTATDIDGTVVAEDTTTITALEPYTPFAVVIGDLLPDGVTSDVQLTATAANGSLSGVSFAFNEAKEPAIGAVAALASVPVLATRFSFDFAENLDGFTSGFADYPAGEELFYELSYGYFQDPNGAFAPYIRGNNHSDDLFMFVKRQISGLLPNTTYDIAATITVYTNAPAGCVGIGGAPGESVYVKAGATVIEPIPAAIGGDMTLNIDKGNQAQGGAAMKLLDHLGVETDCSNPDFLSKTFSDTLTVTTDAGGSVWFSFGTDSGFEGTSEWFVRNVVLDFDAQ